MISKISYVILTVVLILVVGALSLGLYVVLKGTNAKDATPIPTDTRVYETVTLPNYGISFELPKDYEACEQYDPSGPIVSPLIEFTHDDLAYIRRDDSCNFTGDAPDFQLRLQRDPTKSLREILEDGKDYFSPYAEVENIKDETKEINGRTLMLSVYSSHDALNGTSIAAAVKHGRYAFVVVGFGFLDNFPGDQYVVERLLGTITVPEGGIVMPWENN